MKTLQTVHRITISPKLKEALELIPDDESYTYDLRCDIIKNRVTAPIGLKMIIGCATKVKNGGNREGKVAEVWHIYGSDHYLVRIDWMIEDSDDAENFAQIIHGYLDRYPDMLSICCGDIVKCEPYNE